MEINPSSNERHGLFRLHPSVYSPGSCDVEYVSSGHRFSPSPIPISRSNDFSQSIVAIHGLNGHPFTTWTDKHHQNHLWLRDSLPNHVPNCRVMTFGYDSALLFSQSEMKLVDFAQDLLTRLHHAREDPVERKRPLVFICHSLGGIVAKLALVLASLNTEQHRDIMKSAFSIAFFGTPHRGSRSASLAKMLSRILNVASFGFAIRSDLLRTLEVHSQELDDANQFSRDILSRMSIVSFYEQQPLGASLVRPDQTADTCGDLCSVVWT